MNLKSFSSMAELARFGHDFIGASDTNEKKTYISEKRLVAYGVVSATDAEITYNSHDEWGGKVTAIDETLGQGTLIVGKVTDFEITAGRCVVFFAPGQMEDNP